MDTASRTTKLERTVVVGVGERGKRIVQALSRRLQERHGGLPLIQLFAVVASCDSERDRSCGVSLIDLGLRHEHPCEADIVAAFAERRASVEEAISEGLLRLSLAGNRAEARTKGFAMRSGDQVQAYLIADLREAIGRALVFDLARRIGEVVDRRLASVAIRTAVLLLPDSLAPGNGEEEDLDEARVALERFDRHAGGEERPGHALAGDCRTGRQESAFNGACYLLGFLNENGVAMGGPEAMEEMVAEWLYQVTASPLGDALDELEVPAWPQGGEAYSYASFGLAALAFPANDLVKAHALRLAREMATAMSASGENESPSVDAPCAAASDEGVDPGRLIRASLNLDRGMERYLLGQQEWAAVSLRNIRSLGSKLDGSLVKRLETTAQLRGCMERVARCKLMTTKSSLGTRLARLLDENPLAGIRQGERLLEGVRLAAEEERLALSERAAARRLHLDHLGQQMREVRAQLDELTARFPDWNPEDMLRLAWQPRRVLMLFLTYLQVLERRNEYVAYAESRIAGELELAAQEVAASFYTNYLPQMELSVDSLKKLRAQIECAAQSLLDRPDDAKLLGSLGFDLERSVLTEEMIGRFYEDAANGPAMEVKACMATFGPLSRWLEEGVSAAQIEEMLCTHAAQRFEHLKPIRAEDLLLEQCPEPEALRAFLDELVEASDPFCTLDEASLGEGMRESVRVDRAIALSNELNSKLAGVLRDSHNRARLVSTGDSERIVAVSVKRGFPLRALPFMQGRNAGRPVSGVAVCRSSDGSKSIVDLCDAGQHTLWLQPVQPDHPRHGLASDGEG